jgi:hypothetical protein
MDEQSKDQINEMSEYEQRRAINIERNNLRLFRLGLLSKEELKRSNDEAWGRRFEKNEVKGESTNSKKGRSSKGISKKRQTKKSSGMVKRTRKVRAAKLKLATQDGVWV